MSYNIWNGYGYCYDEDSKVQEPQLPVPQAPPLPPIQHQWGMLQEEVYESKMEVAVPHLMNSVLGLVPELVPESESVPALVPATVFEAWLRSAPELQSVSVLVSWLSSVPRSESMSELESGSWLMTMSWLRTMSYSESDLDSDSDSMPGLVPESESVLALAPATVLEAWLRSVPELLSVSVLESWLSLVPRSETMSELESRSWLRSMAWLRTMSWLEESERK